MKDKTLIPAGQYCYSLLKSGSFKICPYWSIRNDRRRQENGYCSFLELGDWEPDGTTLLWDQVKECGENDDI